MITHAYATLEVSDAAFFEIKSKLRRAGYQGQFHDNGATIDMHGIAIVMHEAKIRDGEEDVGHLTEREWVVFFLCALGLSNNEIAFTLGLTENTVKRFMGRVLQATGFFGRRELVGRCGALARQAIWNRKDTVRRSFEDELERSAFA